MKKFALAIAAVAVLAMTAPVSAASCGGAPWTAEAFLSGKCQTASVVNAGDNTPIMKAPLTAKQTADAFAKAGYKVEQTATSTKSDFESAGYKTEPASASTGSAGLSGVDTSGLGLSK